MSGRSMSRPNWLTMYAASSGDSDMFLGASGSMAGGITTGGGSPSPGGMYWAMWNTDRSEGSSIVDRRKSSTCGLGVERSMRQCPIDFAPFSAACKRKAAGCGSCA